MMPAPPIVRPSSRSVWFLARLEAILIVAGMWALVWCALMIANARLAQNLAPIAIEVPRSENLAAPAVVAKGTPLATLSIPRLLLTAVILEGSDDDTLGIGLGHIEHTAFPGQTGNVGIAGHRDTFFRPLRKVRVGDEIFLETPHERFRYSVSSFDVVGPNEVGVLAPTDDSTLTLVTCYPFSLIGRAPNRFVVRAARIATISDRVSTIRSTPLALATE